MGLTNALSVDNSRVVRNFSVIRWIVCLVAALCVSCSAGVSDEVTPLTTASNPTSSVATAEVTPSSTASSTTALAASPAASEWSDEQLEVIAAFEAAELALGDARTHPVRIDSVLLGEFFTSPAIAGVVRLLEGHVASGTAVRRPSGGGPDVRYLAVEVDGDLAYVDACEVDDLVIYEIDGDVIDDRVLTLRWAAQLRRVDGRWMWDALEVLSESDGRVACEL